MEMRSLVLALTGCTRYSGRVPPHGKVAYGEANHSSFGKPPAMETPVFSSQTIPPAFDILMALHHDNVVSAVMSLELLPVRCWMPPVPIFPLQSRVQVGKLRHGAVQWLPGVCLAPLGHSLPCDLLWGHHCHVQQMMGQPGGCSTWQVVLGHRCPRVRSRVRNFGVHVFSSM